MAKNLGARKRMLATRALLLLSLAIISGTAARSEKAAGIRWWALGQDFDATETNEVRRLRSDSSPSLAYMTTKQKRFVLKNPGSEYAIARSAKMAIAECQHQFRNRRWNCSTSDTSHGGPLFGNLMNIGCRETAFLYAMTSAALTHTVARACSEGKIFTCTCGEQEKTTQTSEEQFQYGGCSDNLRFGQRFARRYTEAGDSGLDLHAVTMRHNSQAGRKLAIQETSKQCKCVGQSGSCTVRICWIKLVPLKLVGELIKERFDGASKVVADNGGRGGRDRGFVGNGISSAAISSQHGQLSSSYHFVPVHDSHKEPTSYDLVYYDESPDFCTRNARLGISGTSGRRCNGTSLDVDGCELMCCGRGYQSDTEVVLDRCHCRFHWCCMVQCDTCNRTRERHLCH